MKTILASLLEEGKELCWCAILASTFFLRWASHIFADICLFVCSENVWNLTSVQDVVHIFKEALLLDLGIGEQERCLSSLGTCLPHQSFHVLAPFLRSVVLFDFNGENIKIAH